MKRFHVFLVVLGLPAVSLAQENRPPTPVSGSVTVNNTSVNPVPVAVQNPMSSVTVDNGPGNPVPVAQQGTASVAVTNTPTVVAQQSGSWTVQTTGPALGDYFEVGVSLTAVANDLGGVTSLFFPKPALVEQFSVTCTSSSQKVLSIATDVGTLPAGFSVNPPDNSSVIGAAARADVLTSVVFPPGWSGSSVPPTPVRLLVSSSASFTIFRPTSDAANPETCFFFLVGRWVNP